MQLNANTMNATAINTAAEISTAKATVTMTQQEFRNMRLYAWQKQVKFTHKQMPDGSVEFTAPFNFLAFSGFFDF